MSKNILKKIVIVLIMVFVIILISFITLILIKERSSLTVDTISYQGKKYVYLEYNMDIFNYNLNSNNYYEQGIIHPISHERWDIIYLDGDLFVLDSQVGEAKSYYSNDLNYEWFIVFDEEDLETTLPISVTKEELNYLYNMENMERNETMAFNDIKKFATLKKVTKDELISSIVCLAHYKNSWYWRTEIIDENKEGYPEYVIKLPDTLNKKIFNLLHK